MTIISSRTATTSRCNCAADLNERMKPMNYRLTRNLLEENPPVLIEIHKIETKKRTPSHSLVATYCPFCGIKYEPRKSRGVLRGGTVTSGQVTKSESVS